MDGTDNEAVVRPRKRLPVSTKRKRHPPVSTAARPSSGPPNSTAPSTELSQSIQTIGASTAAPGRTALQQLADSVSKQYLVEREQTIQPNNMGSRGRLSELADPDTLDKLFTALADGNYPTVAAAAAGIGESTYRAWIRRAEDDPGSAYAAFAAAIKAAEAQAESRIAARVRAAADAGPQYWAAGMTLLERRHPERWGRRQDTDSNGPRVVVQIGIRANDVQVSTGESAAHNQAIAVTR